MEIKRRRTRSDEHMDRIVSLIAANPGVTIDGATMALSIGISMAQWRRLRTRLIADGRISVVGTLLGPGGGSVYSTSESVTVA